MKNLFVYTDSPPLKFKGHGLSVLLYNILTFLNNPNNTVITNRYYNNVSKEEILNDAKWNTILFDGNIQYIYKNSIPQKVLTLLSTFSYLISLPKIVLCLRKAPTSPIIFAIGASAKPFWKIILLRKFISNPIWLYVVDDLERINQILNNRFELLLIRLFLKSVYKKVDRMIVISEGLKKKYSLTHSIESDVLLPCFTKVHSYSINTIENEFVFVFSGGLSTLYNDTLKKICEALKELNQKYTIRFKLIIQTYSSYKDYQSLYLDSSVAEYQTSLTRSSNLLSFQRANCFLIPYSFDSVNFDLVSTSFPQKVAELIQLGRPLCVVGPSYSSVIKFFKTNNLPYVIDEEGLSDLTLKIEEIIKNRAVDFNNIYQDIYFKKFSNESVLKVLTNYED